MGGSTDSNFLSMKHPFLFPLIVLSAGSLYAADAVPKAGTMVELFNGNDLSGWKQPTGTWGAVGGVTVDPGNPKGFVATEGHGVLLNSAAAKTVDAMTVGEFGDAQIHVEFCVPKGSNSGVYVQGRYEVQILDSYGKAVEDAHDCAAIYERWDAATNKGFEGTAPRVNAAKPPGEWQSFDITFLAPKFDQDGKKTANAKFVKVLHNGQIVHENVEVTGPTRGGGTEEKSTGSIRLQGDHGPVAFRNLTLTPLTAP